MAAMAELGEVRASVTKVRAELDALKPGGGGAGKKKKKESQANVAKRPQKSAELAKLQEREQDLESTIHQLDAKISQLSQTGSTSPATTIPTEETPCVGPVADTPTGAEGTTNNASIKVRDKRFYFRTNR